MSKILDIILSIILIIGVMFLIYNLIVEIIVNSKLERPQDCIIINNQYYCKVRNEKAKTKIYL